MKTRGFWLTQLKDTPVSERRAVLTSLVSDALKVKLLMEKEDDLPLDKSYFELGLTSLGAVELQEHLDAAIDYRINPTVLYNNPTVEHLITYLSREVLASYFKDDGSRIGKSKNSIEEKKDNASEKAFLEDMLDELF